MRLHKARTAAVEIFEGQAMATVSHVEVPMLEDSEMVAVIV